MASCAARARVGTRRQRGGPVGTRAIFGGIFDGGGSKRREAAKAALLEAIEGTQRGVAASEEDVFKLLGMEYLAPADRNV